MIWKFDPIKMTYFKSYRGISLMLLAILILPAIMFWLGFIQGKEHIKIVHLENGITFINGNEETFSQEALVEKMKEMNMKFPHIVLAQAILESNNFRSQLFLQGNNIFGMKKANQRFTTSIGTIMEHALYKNWEHSLIDYGIWQSRWDLNKIKGEEDYFDLLKTYAEDPEYSAKLKNIIAKHRLRDLFYDKN